MQLSSHSFKEFRSRKYTPPQPHTRTHHHHHKCPINCSSKLVRLDLKSSPFVFVTRGPIVALTRRYNKPECCNQNNQAAQPGSRWSWGEGKRIRVGVGLGWVRKRIQRLLSISALGLQWRGILKIMKQSSAHAGLSLVCVALLSGRPERGGC